MSNTKHIGRNIRNIRLLKGMKQASFAKELGIAQQNVSKMEKKQKLTEEQLDQVAKVLKTTTEAIKEFDENAIINNNILNEQVNNYNINPLEKVAELFREILLLKDNEIKRLQEELEEFKNKEKTTRMNSSQSLRSTEEQNRKAATE
jgi:transcriptional regulator with XRE-family HTH domain